MCIHKYYFYYFYYKINILISIYEFIYLFIFTEKLQRIQSFHSFGLLGCRLWILFFSFDSQLFVDVRFSFPLTRSSPHRLALPPLINPLQTGHRPIIRLRSWTNMSFDPRRLTSPADFETIVSPDGLISICGFGSLLSGTYNQVTFLITIVVFMFSNFLSFGRPIFLCEPERSARSTFPDLINFRVAKLNGFRRVFAHAAPIFFERGIAKPETKVPRNRNFIFYLNIICWVSVKTEENYKI